jgi:hypothetical protein
MHKYSGYTGILLIVMTITARSLVQSAKDDTITAVQSGDFYDSSTWNEGNGDCSL